MNYKDLSLFDFESRKENLNYFPEKEEMIKNIWQQDELAYVNWIVGLLI